MSKDRSGLFDDTYFTITQETGKKLRKWLDDGAEIQNDIQATGTEGGEA